MLLLFAELAFSLVFLFLLLLVVFLITLHTEKKKHS